MPDTYMLFRLYFYHIIVCTAGTGYGSQNTGSATETAKSYIPGTEANRESRAASGQDPNRYTGSGSNQGYGSNTGSGIPLSSCTVCMQAIVHATQVI